MRAARRPTAGARARGRPRVASLDSTAARAAGRPPRPLRGGRDAERRQQTLRATIEWSYELAHPGERHLFAALSVFRGGWTLEAAEKVADADVELLQSLVDKSLVRRWESGRFGMLDTIREFAAERLEPTRRDELGRRLLRHLLDLFESANLGPQEIGEPDMAVAQEERANVDAALDWAANAGETDSALALMLLLELYWATNDPTASRSGSTSCSTPPGRPRASAACACLAPARRDPRHDGAARSRGRGVRTRSRDSPVAW